MSWAPFLAPERDDGFALGRAKASGGTIYYTLPGHGPLGTSTLAAAINVDYYCPITVTTPVVIDQVAAEVTTLEAGDNFRIGLYRADRDLQPIGAPLLDSGDISTASTGVKTFSPATALYLPRGRYLQVLNTSAAAAVFRTWVTDYLAPRPTTLGSGIVILYFEVGRTYAAFPTPGTAWTTATPSAGIGNGMTSPYLFRVLTP